MLQRAWRNTRGRVSPEAAACGTWPHVAVKSAETQTSVERRAPAHTRCGGCVKLSSVKQKGLRSEARGGRCYTKLSHAVASSAPRIARPVRALSGAFACAC